MSPQDRQLSATAAVSTVRSATTPSGVVPRRDSDSDGVVAVVFAEPEFSRNFNMYAVGIGVFLMFAALFTDAISSPLLKAVVVVASVILPGFLIKMKDRGLARHVNSLDIDFDISNIVADEPNLFSKTAAVATSARWVDKGVDKAGILRCVPDFWGRVVYDVVVADLADDDIDGDKPWFVSGNGMTPGRWWGIQ